MPRGGRRRGAGAPIGNLNAVTNGNHSRRLWEVGVALKTLEKRWDEPALRAIMTAIRDAGLAGSGQQMRANLPAIINFIHPILFDRRHGVSINDNRTNAVLGLPRPPRRRALQPATASHRPRRPISQNTRKYKKQSNEGAS
jgi:hypothetical protein